MLRMKTRSELGLAAVLLLPSFTSVLAAPVDFARDIQPLFASRCYECHGERKQ